MGFTVRGLKHKNRLSQFHMYSVREEEQKLDNEYAYYYSVSLNGVLLCEENKANS